MFKRTGNIFKMLSIALLSVTWLTSCIYETDSNCMLYTIKPCLEDNSGAQRNDTAVKRIVAYLFTRSKFEREVEAQSNGDFIVSFDKNVNTALLLWGYPSTDSLMVNIPKVDESINDVSLSLLSSMGNTVPDGLYYGRYDYKPSAQKPAGNEISVAMHTERAAVHVVVENLTEMYGSGGSYGIEISGFRNFVAFNDTIGGDSVTYNPKASFDTKNNLCSDAVYTLPTKIGEGVTVTIYRNDKLIWQSAKDSDGNAATLASGDNKALVVDVEKRGVGFQIMSWNDYVVSTVIN